jgi:WD40 repeat protein
MLARRLARHGLAVTGSSLAAALAAEAAAAPAAAVSTTIKAACSLAAGQAGAVAVSAQVAALTEGVVKAMFLTQIQKATAVLLVLGLAALACGALAAGRQTPQGDGERAAEKEGIRNTPQPNQVPAPQPKGPALDPLPAGAVAQFGTPRLQDFTIDRSAAFSPDGQRLATSGSNSPICVWEVATGRLVRTYANRGSVFDLCWKPDGKLAALTFFGHDTFLMQEFGDVPDVTQDEEKRLHEEANRRERGEDGKRRQEHLNQCFLSADGRRVVAVWNSAAKPERRASVYRFARTQTSDTVKAEHEVAIPSGYGAWLSGDGKFLLAHEAPNGDGPNRLHAFDLTAARDKVKPAWKLNFPGGQEHQPDFCFSPDGKRVVLLFWNSDVELWDGPSGKRIRELPKLPWYYHQNNGERRGIDLAPDGKRLALIERGPNGLMGGRVVDVETGRDVCRLAPRPMPQSSGIARFSADGKRLARVSFGVAALWNVETGEDACPLPGHRGDVNSFALVPGGKVVTAGEDLTARAWDPATGKEAWRAALPQVMVVKFATPDGAIIVQERSGNPRTARCLDAATGRMRPLPGKLAAAREDHFLACSPDGKTLVTLDTRKAAFRVWSWPAGELRTTVSLFQQGALRLTDCDAAHFTPDGKHFVAVVYYSDPAEQQEIRQVPDHPFVETWDLAAGRQLGRVELQPGKSPLLIPHSTGVYFWGKGDEVRDAVSGRALGKLHMPMGRGLSLEWIRGMALSPDGRTLAACWGFNDQHVLLFETWTGRFREMLPEAGKSVTGLSFLPDGRLVSLGTTATVWSIGLHPDRAPAAGVAEEWERLADPDPEKAWPAMGKLAGSPAEAVEVIRQHIRAVPRLSDKALARIFRDLNSEEFKDREAASKELDRLGPPAVPRVKAELAERLPAEVKRRLEVFLAEHDRESPSPDELRALRAAGVLEAVATPAARKVLGELAGGEPTARRTQEAAGALCRLGRR